MAEFQEVIFLLQFVILIVLFLVKFYNVLNLGQLYSWAEGFIIFTVATLVYGSGFITSILSYDTNLIIQLFKLETGLILLTTLFFIVELILSIVGAVKANTRGSHNAMEYYYNVKK